MKQALLQQQEQPKTHDLGFEERLGFIVDGEKPIAITKNRPSPQNG